MIVIEPDFSIPLPQDLKHEDPKDLHEKVTAAFNTTEFLMENGLEKVYISQEDVDGARRDFMTTEESQATITTPGKALMLKALLSEYDLDVVRSAVQLRNYVKLRLLELSSCGRESTELRALELLGKLSDVNAFQENINVTVEHKTTREIESELATKLSAYLEEVTDAEIVEQTPVDPVKALKKLPTAEEALGSPT